MTSSQIIFTLRPFTKFLSVNYRNIFFSFHKCVWCNSVIDSTHLPRCSAHRYLLYRRFVKLPLHCSQIAILAIRHQNGTEGRSPRVKRYSSARHQQFTAPISDLLPFSFAYSFFPLMGVKLGSLTLTKEQTEDVLE